MAGLTGNICEDGDGGHVSVDRLYIVMYHYVRDLMHSRYPGIKGLDVKLFKQQIDYLCEHFNIVRMEDIIAWKMSGGNSLPENAMLLTFDDGYVDHYTYAFPILEEAGVQGSFFIPGKTFTTHQLLDVNKIHYILASVDIERFLMESLILAQDERWRHA